MRKLVGSANDAHLRSTLQSVLGVELIASEDVQPEEDDQEETMPFDEPEELEVDEPAQD